MAPTNCCFQRPSLGQNHPVLGTVHTQRRNCPCPEELFKYNLKKKKKKEQMQQERKRLWNNSGIELAGKTNNGQHAPSAFLQSLQITEQ